MASKYQSFSKMIANDVTSIRLTFILSVSILTSLTSYGQTKSPTITRKQAIENIKLIFDNYVQYDESTDSKINQDLMSNSLKSLNRITDLAELTILINVWMYYDPTDFQDTPEIVRILKISSPQSIQAVKKRIVKKEKWEREELAPYADLKNLLRQLEDE
ncbi:MAG: hypothetical protein EOO46_23250 [Flavobacterium sp.]|nr:MAG: hypothetical protein EOO46_23250 [Flavobacterium sp.]